MGKLHPTEVCQLLLHQIIYIPNIFRSKRLSAARNSVIIIWKTIMKRQ